ncbi:MAG: CinA family nicotinamide mononucleotide deamidase-related protein [Anaerolineae bacterium]
MNAEIVLTGTELLLGEIVDTNSVMVARMLRDIGLDLHYKTTVGDNETRIAQVLRNALERADVVIVSGGLGPTVDDVTRQAAALAAGRKLVYSQTLEVQIAARFERFGRKMGQNNKRQAWIPEGAIPIENPVGTAPCFIVETDRGSIICLPGVPRELEHQMTHAIIPYLKAKMGAPQIIKAKILRTCGIGESNVDRQIDDLMRAGNPTVGLAAHLGQVDIRITAKADSEAQARALLAPVEAEIRRRLGDVIFGVDDETLVEVVGQLLQRHNLRLALVDTLTGGEAARQLEQAGYAEQVLPPQLFESPAQAAVSLQLPAEESTPEGEPVARQLARHTGQPGALGVSVVGPVKTPTAPKASLVGVAHNGRVSLQQYQFGYYGQTGRQWLTVQVFDQIWRRLRDQ